MLEEKALCERGLFFLGYNQKEILLPLPPSLIVMLMFI
jgi:hypothetical protein